MIDSSWLGLGAFTGVVIGVIASCWQKIKSLAWKMTSYAVVQIEIKDTQTSNAVLAYLINHYKISSIYDKMYGASYDYTRIDGKYGMISYEFLGDKTLTFWSGFFPLYFGISNQQAQHTNQNQQNPYWQDSPKENQNVKTLTFIRGTYDAELIIKSACDQRNELSWNTNKDPKQKRFFIRKIPTSNSQNEIGYSVGTSIAWYHEGHYRLLKHKPWELGKSRIDNKKALDYLIFPERIKRMIREIQIWRNNRDWYLERGLPWKRGWILYGPPGTGKSKLSCAFAEDEDMPLFVFSLGEMTNGELQRSWEEMQSHIPCIALFEDIDNVFHGRNNISGKNIGFGQMFGSMSPNKPNTKGDNHDRGTKIGMLSFDCLLNCIDGVEKSEGIFTIITTNDISKIDPALGQPRKLPDGTIEFISSRPGRIDKAIELTYMERNDKIIMAERILKGYPEGYELMMEFLDKYPDLQETPAQFQERCAQLAISYFWKDKSEKEGLIGKENIDKVFSLEVMPPRVEHFVDPYEEVDNTVKIISD